MDFWFQGAKPRISTTIYLSQPWKLLLEEVPTMSKVVPRSLLETCVKKFLFLVKRVKRCHPKRRVPRLFLVRSSEIYRNRNSVFGDNGLKCPLAAIIIGIARPGIVLPGSNGGLARLTQYENRSPTKKKYLNHQMT